jgi:hypothetical protein
MCRLCVTGRIRTLQCRGLTQINDPPSEPTKNILTKTDVNAKPQTDAPIRRVPIRELLALRRDKDIVAPELLVKPSNTGGKRSHAERSGARSQAQSPIDPRVAEIVTAHTETVSVVRSLRAKTLEQDTSPLPSAPTTRIRNKTFSKKEKASHRRKSTSASLVTKLRKNESKKTIPTSQIQRGISPEESTCEQAELPKIERIWSESIEMTPVKPQEQRPIPTLEHNLDRVLFKYLTL